MRPLLFLLLPLTACSVDKVESNGELGRLGFEVLSDWYVDPVELTEVGIVTGHPQRFHVSLTSDGKEEADGDAADLRYRMSPASGVSVEQDEEDDEDETPPDLTLTVEEAGDYTLEAVLHGEVFDWIELRFAAPVVLDLALFVRGPWAQDFERLEAEEGVAEVEEGTQLAWLPIPTGEGDERLVGDVETDMGADPADLVVPADNVEHVNEDEVTENSEVPSLFFIEPGDVTITVSDTVNPAVGTQAFTVTE